ncbi:MAG TPA: twin-arginine translocase TatA/TatE family subunit [Patescibacteria group bacterium]|nr:twin-arginine translocase TatA/TatE family subunit [Patescibacteria group bacterium]
MFDNIGRTEIIVVAVVLLIIFGPKKLPEFAKGIADAVKEIMHAFNGDKEEVKKKPEKK